MRATCHTTYFACIPLLAILLVVAACSHSAQEATSEKGSERLTRVALVKATAGQFQPLPLPDPGIPGYKFPEAEDTVVDWSKTNNQQAINLHAWGLWTALTTESNQVFNGQKLLVFETWDDPSDLTPTPPTAAGRVRRPRRLEVPRQFQHGAAAKALFTAAAQPGAVRVDVKYDPTAADFILNNSLFSAAQLSSYLNTDHKTAVPAFPNTAISLKPTYRTLKPLIDNRYYMLKVWPGPPPLVFNQSSKHWESKPFPDSLWGQCVWIDTQGSGNTAAAVDKTCAANGSSRTVASTYGLDQFIHFQMTQADADQLNATAAGCATSLSAGDYAVLVGMHATSREITRWTWQTFWWVNAPDNPAAPSSHTIASGRPAQLSGAARHYAQCTGYDEEVPPQPNSGGSNSGDTVYCYNPYLEAPFGPSVLSDSQPGNTQLNGKTITTANNVGVQTNCMSCHEQAHYNPNNIAPAPQYTGARYVDLNGTAFNGVLKVDFLWTIPDNAK